MGRPRTFDETAVLDAAAGEFRVHGFADTSTERLCEAAGVRRSSLYNAFTSKDDLFARALERYVEAVRERQTALLEDDALSGADRLRALVDVVIGEEEVAARDGHAAGCMVVQSLMSPDLRERDDRVARLLDHDLRARTALLAGVIRAGRIDGSIADGMDAENGAVLVNTVISGLRVTAQTGMDPERLRRIALAGLSALLD
ncbi:TetR/AcrR family transcriptional regulator [Streptomyces sp. AJS327]|uniref:TetR/AcrR family transcriptional regulator n=1 Tax=Streptomyces sp. AJS327 TaxID=2545265 RepID=UPI0015DDB3BA|nr:TetR/AcrR family transcriptional regulator [Streptomyces sp. AJS327]MBA0051371.1 TetR/AcrR family transcriptional regulator [Streptomyces sp. AJS327]